MGAVKVVLAEKPSVARELAAVLNATSRHDGYLAGNGYQVTWALGHLVGLQEPADYDPALKRWSLSTLPFVPQAFKLKLRGDKQARQQYAIVQRLFRGADELICATDAGREGELIFRYILTLTGCTNKPAQRLWLTSLTPQAIRAAFRSLQPLSDYNDLYAAAKCRSEADWIVGLNATRNYTVRYGTEGMLWSLGRVQTPVLAMIVRRDDEIRTFKPQPFWELMTNYRRTRFRFHGERFDRQNDAEVLLARVRDHEFVIKKITSKPEKSLPPQLYDLTDLQRDMNRRYGLSAEHTLQSAQSLYEKKLITYPRSDSRYLTADMKQQVADTLHKLRAIKHDEISKLDLQVLAFGSRIVSNRQVRDHHAIIPTGGRPGDLSSRDQKVYDAIVVRFIAAFYPPCLKEVTTVDGAADDVPFRARGVRVTAAGWTALYPRKAAANSIDKESEAAQSLADFSVGERGPHDPVLKQGETTPPKHFTENTLLGAMETAGKLVEESALRDALKEKGLGTPATRASIIETLLKRQYITRTKKHLVATDLGRYLIALVRDERLKSPELTGEWEAELKRIEAGRAAPTAFMQEIVAYTKHIIGSCENVTIDQQTLGICPQCGHPVMRGKRGYGCSKWHDGCPFVLWPMYEGRDLDENQVRALLQHGITLRPITMEDGRAEVLTMLASGALVGVPVPSSSGQSSGKPSSRGRRHRRDPPGKNTAKRSRQPPNKKAASDELGTCPLCGAQVAEQKKSFSCSRWKDGCGFVIWRTISGKRISARTARALLRDGQTAVLKGFKSKAGRPYSARLKLQEGTVRLDFDR